MKKLILILLLFGLSFKSNSQMRLYDGNSSKKNGLVLTLSGISFTTAGLCEGFYNYRNWVPSDPQRPYLGGQWVKKPWYKQGGRPYVIGVGVTLTFTGLITLISNKN